MNRTIIVSNRLPISIDISDEKSISLTQSVGGLATGLQSVYKQKNCMWMGWPGISSEGLEMDLVQDIETKLNSENCHPIWLSNEDMDLYYHGFSNRTIWPLFHYFMQYVDFNDDYWEGYLKVNQFFANKVLEMCKDGDTVWIHDYHLLLLPRLLRESSLNLHIGFFLHIPFPSYEVLRILPWRNQIIDGLLGADLIGFHTYDYERHYLSSVRRILGYEISFNEISLPDRLVKVDVFPMGIDYARFYDLAYEVQAKSFKEKTSIGQEISKYKQISPKNRLIVSIDRLDYTKGIPQRLQAFEAFLEQYPEYVGTVSLVMLATPTRDKVPQYQSMKSEVDELVGRINGRFSSVNYTPIWYFYRSWPIEQLIDLYIAADVAMIIPVRDGMNLVAKEYIVSKSDYKGVLILSEMAGAAKEMGEALIVNPNNRQELVESIRIALEMPVEEQERRNRALRSRLKRYDISKWKNDYLEALNEVAQKQIHLDATLITSSVINTIKSEYKQSNRRLILLDYDGTLVNFKTNPNDAFPDEELYQLLDTLSSDSNTDLVLVSGRDKDTFTQWFQNRQYHLIAEHGVWIRRIGEEWNQTLFVDTEWKKFILPIIQIYVDRTPGSFIEEKKYSLVWHYRGVDPELGQVRYGELKDELTSLIANHNLQILEGSKVVEVKNTGVDKGRGVTHFRQETEYDFILAIGDDWTDEYLFKSLPQEAFSIKVGMINSKARYNIKNVKAVRELLEKLQL